MKISLIFFLLTTWLFSQSQDTQIKDYFNSLNNKTILIEIFENQSVFNANISLNDPKIYFETIEVDSTVSLFENNVISEETKSEIETAWETAIQENRDKVSADLREEFASKYEHDKTAMVEAVDKMLSDRITAELSEFAEDRQGLIEAKAKYAKKMKGDSKAMESFILSNLKKELGELREDRKSVANNVAKLESFIVNSLAKEIAEFHADKKDLAETKVKLVRDSKAKFEAIKKEFIDRASRYSNNPKNNAIIKPRVSKYLDVSPVLINVKKSISSLWFSTFSSTLLIFTFSLSESVKSFISIAIFFSMALIFTSLESDPAVSI